MAMTHSMVGLVMTLFMGAVAMILLKPVPGTIKSMVKLGMILLSKMDQEAKPMMVVLEQIP